MSAAYQRVHWTWKKYSLNADAWSISGPEPWVRKLLYASLVFLHILGTQYFSEWESEVKKANQATLPFDPRNNFILITCCIYLNICLR